MTASVRAAEDHSLTPRDAVDATDARWKGQERRLRSLIRLGKFVIISERQLNLINLEVQPSRKHKRPFSMQDHLSPGCESPPGPRETIRINNAAR